MIDYLNQNPFYRFQSLKCIRRINVRNNILLSIYTYLYIYIQSAALTQTFYLLLIKELLLLREKYQRKTLFYLKI